MIIIIIVIIVIIIVIVIVITIVHTLLKFVTLLRDNSTSFRSRVEADCEISDVTEKYEPRTHVPEKYETRTHVLKDNASCLSRSLRMVWIPYWVPVLKRT